MAQRRIRTYGSCRGWAGGWALGLACLLALAGCASGGPAPTRSPGAAPASTRLPPTATANPTETPEPPRDGSALALVNGTLIDGTGAEPVTGAAVLIRDGRIVAAGPRDRVSIPAGARVIDVEGATILPGFINAHVHRAYDEANLRAWAQAGVTTVRDLSPFSRSPEALQRAYALRDETLVTPELARIVAASPMLTAPGGYGMYEVTSAEDARRAVNDLLDLGADLIKTTCEDNLQGRTWATLSAEELRAIVETAHARGRPVSVHVSRAEHAEQALAAGVDDLAHMAVDEVPDELLDRLVAADVYWVPTLELWQGVGWGAGPVANLRRFVAAGGQVALGTDYAGYTIEFDLGMPMHEVEFMHEAGMTPMQIVVAATRNAAHVCGREGDLGTLEPGKVADVLVVDGDPLTDVRALRDVRLVVKDGAVIRGEAGESRAG